MSENAKDSDTHPNLLDLLTEWTVQAQQSVTAWEQAADRVGKLLVDAGTVEQRYVDAMKQVLRDMGAYAVIAPGIVLLHARPEDGVIEPTFGMVTLATPVPFGHPDNDPVDIVLAFGAVDKQAHITALQQLAKLLMDPVAVERIRTASDDQELVSVIRSLNSGSEPTSGPREGL